MNSESSFHDILSWMAPFVSMLIVVGLLCWLGWAAHKVATARPSSDDVENRSYLEAVLAPYFKRRRAGWPTLILGALLAVGLAGVYLSEVAGRSGPAHDFFASLRQSEWVFLVYGCFFAAQWIVYFLSRYDNSPLRVRTLRGLLNEASANWRNNAPDSQAWFTKKYRAKSKSSITSIAVLAAVATVVLSVSVQLFAASPLVPDPQGPFKLFCVQVAIASSLISSLMFIFAIDALDSVHNWFEDEKLRGILLRYFYHLTITPKYVGFVLLMTSLVFLAAWADPALGSIGLTGIGLAGHRYWFPSFDDSPTYANLRTAFFFAAGFLPVVVAIMA